MSSLIHFHIRLSFQKNNNTHTHTCWCYIKILQLNRENVNEWNWPLSDFERCVYFFIRSLIVEVWYCDNVDCHCIHTKTFVYFIRRLDFWIFLFQRSTQNIICRGTDRILSFQFSYSIQFESMDGRRKYRNKFTILFSVFIERIQS